MIILAIFGAVVLTGLLWFFGINLLDNYVGYQTARYKADDSQWGIDWLRRSRRLYWWSLLLFSASAAAWWWLIGSNFVHITIGWK